VLISLATPSKHWRESSSNIDSSNYLEYRRSPVKFPSYRYTKLMKESGGAVGFITYDSIVHFEPVTKPSTPLINPLPGLPEAFFMITSTLIIFDHIYQTIKLVSHVHLPDGTSLTELPALYEKCVARIGALRQKLESPNIPLPKQGPIKLGASTTSNVGKVGYEGFVTKLKEHIVKGDIIQAVPSQRLARSTALHPFNIYRHLRRINPSPYMFYLNCGDVQVIGASPETLCKVEGRKVYNHAIAGTVRRGKTAEGKVHILCAICVLRVCRGCKARRRVAKVRERSSRTHYACRSRSKRCQPSLQARDSQRG